MELRQQNKAKYHFINLTLVPNKGHGFESHIGHQCNSIVAFTTNWKFDIAVLTVYLVLMNVNNLFALIHSHLFQIDVI